MDGCEGVHKSAIRRSVQQAGNETERWPVHACACVDLVGGGVGGVLMGWKETIKKRALKSKQTNPCHRRKKPHRERGERQY